MGKLEQVTKEAFWLAVGNKDLISTPIGNHPYTTKFTYRGGALFGSIVSFLPYVDGKPQQEYFLYRSNAR